MIDDMFVRDAKHHFLMLMYNVFKHSMNILTVNHNMLTHKRQIIITRGIQLARIPIVGGVSNPDLRTIAEKFGVGNPSNKWLFDN